MAVYAGGSKYFDESTGKYKPGYKPGKGSKFIKDKPYPMPIVGKPIKGKPIVGPMPIKGKPIKPGKDKPYPMPGPIDMFPNPPQPRIKPGIPNGPTVGTVYKTY